MENKGEEENMCDTGLVLGLNYDNCSNSSRIDHRHGRGASVKFERSASNCVQLGRSLSLGITDDGLCESAKEFAGGHRSSTFASKLGDQSQGLGSKTVKKESDEGSEEMERPLSHTSDEEEDGSTRKKLRLTKEQSLFLEEKFKEQSTLNPKQKQTLAEQLNLRPRQVEVWFQNRRARTKLKQTKVDREVLMKCCEKLTDENRRLQKELQELKLLKLSPALLMQHPPVSAPAAAASFTMCPSCERIAGGSDGTKGAGPVVVSPSKPHFLNPFARSAAC